MEANTDIGTWIMLTAFLILVVTDVWLWRKKGVATFSEIITKNSMYSPWIPLAIGILLGHWFW